MSLSSKIVLSFIVLAAVVGGAFFMGGEPDKPAATPSAAKSATPVKAAPLPTAKPSPSAPAMVTESSSPAGGSPNSVQSQDEIIATIDDASVLYSPEGLPKIQPYLLHADPEVRAAAIDGMVNLGEAGGAPLLRAASQLAPTPEDAAAMREAAAYLDLPPGRLPKRSAPSK